MTRHEVGQGSAWYLSTELDNPAHDRIIAAAVAAAGLAASTRLPAGVEAVRRRGTGDRSWLFLLNHTTEPLVARLTAQSCVRRPVAGSVELPPEGVAVVRSESSARVGDGYGSNVSAFTWLGRTTVKCRGSRVAMSVSLRRSAIAITEASVVPRGRSPYMPTSSAIRA